MFRTGYKRLAFILSVCLLLLGAGHDLADREPTSRGVGEEAEILILRHFLENVHDFLGAKSGSRSYGQLVSGKQFFSHITGEVSEVGGPRYLAFVSLTDFEVTYFLNREERLDSFPSADRDRDPMSAVHAQVGLVLVTEEEASDIASRFLKVAVGNSELGDLCQVSGGLRDRGSYFVYSFVWNECVDEEGNATHLSRVIVELNPKNGRVISFFRQSSRPSGEFSVSTLAARLETASAIRKELRNAQVVRRVPFEFYFEDGSSEDACEIQYEGGSAGSDEVSSIVVSLRDFRDLSGPDTETLDSGIWDTSLVCP